MEVLKQLQYQPMPVEEQVAILYVTVNGHLDGVPVGEITSFEQRFLAALRADHPDMLREIAHERRLTDAARAALETAVAAVREGVPVPAEEVPTS
jgi:F-type H+-transporting ATPase subunit alpha